jgi:peptidoglycan/LPS O-acetylase OafA/YrhL
MGILRFLLALAVVVVHTSHMYGFDSYGLKLTGGVVAVQTFYMISGFYMALILSTKYVGKGSYGLFLSNRFLRIYPAYWVVLVLTLAVSASGSFTHIFGFGLEDYVGNRHILSPVALFFLITTNLILFGQDAVLFLGIDSSGGLYFTTNFMATKPGVYTFMPLPQAWTLSLELMFYVIAPFFVKRRTSTLISVIFVSLLLRLYIYFGAGLYQDPWTYRFFPTELAFFLAGVVSYRLYVLIGDKSVGNMPTIATLLVVGVTVAYQWFPGGATKQWLYYSLVWALMPLLFMFSKSKGSMDGWIGELSYPIYISHIFVLLLLSPFLDRLSPSSHIVVIVCVATVMFSVALMRFVMTPVENFRQKRVTIGPGALDRGLGENLLPSWWRSRRVD